MVTIELYPSLLITISAIYAVCAVYLVNHYRLKRRNITLLLIVFFAFSSFFYFGYYLNLITILPTDNFMVIPFFALTILGILLLIAIVMLEIRELYLLPPFIVIVGLVQIYIAGSTRIMTINILQFVSYLITRRLVGVPWLIFLKAVSPVFVSLTNSYPYLGILSTLLDPLTEIIPQVYISILAFYSLVISTPTIILFSFLAWRNRSGRSLGFALGIIAGDISILLGANQITHGLIMVAAAALFALGIFGVFDKLMQKKETQERNLKAKNK